MSVLPDEAKTTSGTRVLRQLQIKADGEVSSAALAKLLRQRKLALNHHIDW